MRLGLRTREFWDVTLTELEALREQHEAAGRELDLRAGVVAAAAMNATRWSPDSKLWEASDFFASLRPPLREQTDEEIAATLEALWGGGGAAVAERAGSGGAAEAAGAPDAN